MADGGRAGSKQKLDFSEREAIEVDRAARRIARMFGFGGAWDAPCAYDQGDGQDSTDSGDRMTVAHRGRVDEKASFAIVNGVRVRLVKRQHRWTAHKGISAVPMATPLVERIAALGFLRVSKPALDLLIAYSCEDMAAWLRVEPHLHREIPTQHQLAAGRDAMARIMFRRAAVTQDERARQLGTRASGYREETAQMERFLRAWLVAAATAFNSQPNFKIARAGASQGNGFRSQDLWCRCNATYRRRPSTSGDGQTSSERTK
ncbi:MAG: hypothetical protein WC829_11415 [Hyphomicrobium sp.]|jgi:hypothetical protein